VQVLFIVESVIPKFSDMVFKRNCTVVFCVFLRACFLWEV